MQPERFRRSSCKLGEETRRRSRSTSVATRGEHQRESARRSGRRRRAAAEIREPFGPGPVTDGRKIVRTTGRRQHVRAEFFGVVRSPAGPAPNNRDCRSPEQEAAFSWRIECRPRWMKSARRSHARGPARGSRGPEGPSGDRASLTVWPGIGQLAANTCETSGGRTSRAGPTSVDASASRGRARASGRTPRPSRLLFLGFVGCGGGGVVAGGRGVGGGGGGGGGGVGRWFFFFFAGGGAGGGLGGGWGGGGGGGGGARRRAASRRSASRGNRGRQLHAQLVYRFRDWRRLRDGWWRTGEGQRRAGGK